ncbi:MAG: glycosyltransferase [Lysobacter sp.]
MDRALSSLAGVTVVVPVGPGDRVSPQLRAQLAQLPSRARVWVVGCAADAIDEALPTDGAGGPQWRRLYSPQSRSLQQNTGAAAAGSDWLWFLHADAALAPESLPALARFIDAGVSALGYFDLRFLDDGPALMRLNAAGVWLRSRGLRLPFGDQGLVLPRALFNLVGGFDPATTRGEDHQLVWRVRRAGFPVLPVGAPLYTSARRYAARGWGTTTGGHLVETLRQAWRFSRPEQTP